jgi:signal transduction histidine kinase
VAISPGGDQIFESGMPLADSVRRSLTEGLAQIRAGHPGDGRSFMRVVGDTEPLVLAWQTPDRRHPERPLVVGFVADVSFITGVFERILTGPSLLPPSLGADTRRLLGVRVATADGRPVFAPSAPWSPYESETALDPELGGLRLSVALDPRAADTLIIGGLPRSRVPMVLGLIALAAGLVVIAIIQLRREEELARLRADFISGVSHELRTPLAQIRMFGETLLLGRIRSDAERHRSLGIIVQESERLTRLVENVLQFSRAERGGASVSLVPTRLDILIHEIVDSFAVVARSTRAVIVRHVEQGLTAPIDPGAFRQIMLNLLDNAVKYGPPGQTITVSARWEQQAARIHVEDQGPGVDNEHVARIWQPFYRVPASAQATGGTGIGLAIVKQLIDLHHGRVWVERTASTGARFVIELPGATLAASASEWAGAAASVWR